MRWFLFLLVLGGGLFWWQHHTPAPAPQPVVPAVAVATPVPPSREPSFPKQNINRAQAAVDAVKRQRDEL